MIEHIRIKVLLTFLFALLCNLFFYRLMGHTGIALFFVLLFLFEIGVFWQEIQTYRLRGSVGFLGLTLFLLVGNSIRSGNDFVAWTQFVGGAVVLGIVFALTTSGKKAFGSVAELVLAPFRLGLRYLKGAIKFLEFSVSGGVWARILPGKSALVNWLRPLVLGLVIGIPIILIMTGLLTGGDPIFAHFMASLKLPQIPAEWGGRIQLTLLIFFVLVPVTCIRGQEQFHHPLAQFSRLRVAREMTVVLLLVILTLGTFLIIQAPYVFAHVAFETDLSKFGVATYSEYVRRGFGELIAVAFLIYGVLWLATTAVRFQATKKERAVLLWLSGIVFFLTGIFIISIARRVYLYQAYHGWSLVRLYGLWFLAWITVLYTTLALRQWVRRPLPLVTAEIVLSFVFLIAFGSWNAEAFIVRTHPPTVNKRVDYGYLSRLSSDAMSGWKQAYGFARQTLVEKGLENVPEIQMEDRRDVAYSIYIVSRLMDAYRDLVFTYGTAEEQKQFVSAALSQAQRFLTDHIALSEKVLREADIVEIRKELETSKHYLDRVTSWQKDLDNGTVEPYHLMYFFLPRYGYWIPGEGERHFNIYGVTQGVYDREWGMYGFIFDREYLNQQENDTVLDRLYRFSWSGYHAYRTMKTDIPISDLYTLSDTYFRLYKKISSQREGARQFVSDISFTSPFAE